MYLLEEEIEQSLLEELASDQSSFSDESDSSGTDYLTVGGVIGAECCDDESDVHFSVASSMPSASSAIFTWEDMKAHNISYNLVLIPSF
jgi:hypothetical protein